MNDSAITSGESQFLPDAITAVPALFLDAGEKAWFRCLEFFTAHIRNPNTRAAYGRAVIQFCEWTEQRGLTLEQLNPFVVSAYIEELGQSKSRPTVKQHLAALRMLFDYLVIGQIVAHNPVAAVRGPKHVVKKGKTPVLLAEEARSLLESIETNTVAGLRDRALIGVMVFSFARVSAVVGMNVEDYFTQGRRSWFRLHEKGGKRHDVPAHHRADEFLFAYVSAAGIAHDKGTPLFRTLDRNRQLTADRLDRREVLAMIKRRSRRSGLSPDICCHSFRATGITEYLRNGGTIERAAAIAAHESTRTTQLYNRVDDELSLDEIERILI